MSGSLGCIYSIGIHRTIRRREAISRSAGGHRFCSYLSSLTGRTPTDSVLFPDRAKIQGPLVLAAILVVAALILVNAVYVAAEFAAVSARRSRIRQLAEEGNSLAALAAAGPREAGGARSLHRRLPDRHHRLGARARRVRASEHRRIADAAAGRARDSRPSTAQSTSVVIVLLLLTVASGHLRGAGAEGARAPVPDAVRTLRRDADGAVDVGVPAAHHVAERDGARPAPPGRAHHRKRIVTFIRRKRSSC